MTLRALHKRAERYTIGVAATSILITGACISALPGATCTAIAETYSASIIDFGSTALIAMMGFFLFQPEGFQTEGARKFALFIFPFIVIGLFVATIATSTYNIRVATDFCFSGTPEQQAFHQHGHIPLITDRHFWRLISAPRAPDL